MIQHITGEHSNQGCFKEGNETVTNCDTFKLKAKDGKMRNTDMLNTQNILRLIESIPSPKAEPFKMWLAKFR